MKVNKIFNTLIRFGNIRHGFTETKQFKKSSKDFFKIFTTHKMLFQILQVDILVNCLAR